MNKNYAKIVLFAAIILLSQLTITLEALAYIGPGIAVVGIWSLFGPIAAIVTLVLMVGYYPVMYYYKKYKKSKMTKTKETETSEAEDSPITSSKENDKDK